MKEKESIVSFLEENKEVLEKMMKHYAPQFEKCLEEEGTQGLVESVYAAVDDIHEKGGLNKVVTCSKGCSFCCYADVAVSDYEASVIRALVEHDKIPIDKALTDKQNSTEWESLKYADKKCVLLNDKGECSVYTHRPMICRLWNSVSDPKDCDDSEKNIHTKTARILQPWAMMLTLHGLSPKKWYLREIFDAPISYMEYEDWLTEYADEIDIQLAESGADRELDFDRENEYLNRYNKYLDK